MPAPLIWHITEHGVWDAAVRAGSYRSATRGLDLAEQGYIPASWPEQISAVARRVYPDRPDDLVILEIDVSRVEAAGIAVDLSPAAQPPRATDPAGEDPEESPSPRILGPLPISAVVRLRRTKWIGREFVVVA